MRRQARGMKSGARVFRSHRGSALGRDFAGNRRLNSKLRIVLPDVGKINATRFPIGKGVCAEPARTGVWFPAGRIRIQEATFALLAAG